MNPPARPTIKIEKPTPMLKPNAIPATMYPRARNAKRYNSEPRKEKSFLVIKTIAVSAPKIPSVAKPGLG